MERSVQAGFKYKKYFGFNLYKGIKTASRDRAAYLGLPVPGRWEELI